MSSIASGAEQSTFVHVVVLSRWTIKMPLQFVALEETISSYQVPGPSLPKVMRLPETKSGQICTR